MHGTSGQIVNGGLIDFQDNMYRGMADYSTYMNAQQQAMGPGFNGMGAFPGQGMPGMQAHGFPGMAGPMPGVPAPAHLPCISGPPAYLHVNGQTYVPVDAQQPVAASKPAGPAVAESAATDSVVPRVLTEEEIERRVRNRVEEWAAGQRKPVYCAGSATGAAPKKARDRGMTDEDRALDRIKTVNASMRGRFVSPF